MKYYILRTNSVEENLKNTNGYNFKINNLNAERLISDAKDGDIFKLLLRLLLTKQRAIPSYSFPALLIYYFLILISKYHHCIVQLFYLKRRNQLY